jgi:vancomycin resistance protein YoaR
MDELEEIIEEVKEKIERPKKSLGRFFVITTVGIVLLGATGAVALAYVDDSYKGKVYPGIQIGAIDIGGMQKQELEKFLKDMNDKLSADGFRFVLKNENKERKFTLFPVSADDSPELMRIDVKKEAARLVNYGKEGNFITRLFTFARTSWTKPQIPLESIFVDENGIQKALRDQVASEVVTPTDADIIVDSRNPVRIRVVPAQKGLVYDFSGVKNELLTAWSVLKSPEVTLQSEKKDPLITEKEIDVVTKNIDAIFAGGPLVLVSTQDGQEKKWEVKESVLQSWIGVRQFEGDQVGLGIKSKEVKKYLEYNIEPDVNIEAEDARFLIRENGEVKEFEGSKVGTKINQELTLERINQVIHGRSLQNSATSTIQLAVDVVEPEVKTGEVNNLGIKQILGVGTSNFKGSPSNRVHNITAAVKKLNGILIKPGEEFSSIAHTQPYTLEAGYLPEKVIKGDKIIPEIGGGLCQVGTTLFRMAMNSGMDITERRNHSLVVNYYNDPSNNLPGTDATIYDPAPDFKFKNDTENYILIQTSVDPKKGDLKFTLWGTDDGRKASYSKPVVLRWIPTGPTRTIVSTSLKPGAKECQHAYRGADTSFVYTRVMSDGTEEKKTFESHYRPLPEICLVGAESGQAPCTGESCPVIPGGDSISIPLSEGSQNTPNNTPQNPAISG